MASKPRVTWSHYRFSDINWSNECIIRSTDFGSVSRNPDGIYSEILYDPLRSSAILCDSPRFSVILRDSLRFSEVPFDWIFVWRFFIFVCSVRETKRNEKEREKRNEIRLKSEMDSSDTITCQHLLNTVYVTRVSLRLTNGFTVIPGSWSIRPLPQRTQNPTPAENPAERWRWSIWSQPSGGQPPAESQSEPRRKHNRINLGSIPDHLIGTILNYGRSYDLIDSFVVNKPVNWS